MPCDIGAACRFWLVAGLLGFFSPAQADDASLLPAGDHLVGDTALSFESVAKRNLVPTSQAPGGGTPPPSDPLLNYQYKKSAANLYQSLQYESADSFVVTLSDYCSLISERYGYEGSGNYSNLFGRNCGDPALSGIFRLLRQADSPSFPVNLDVGAGFAPNLIKGSFYQPVIAAGTEVGDINLSLNHIFDKASLLGRIGVQISGQARFEGGDGSEVLSARHQFYLDLAGQYRGWEGFPLTLGLRTVPAYGYDERYRYNSASQPIDQDNKYRAGWSFYPYVELSHAFIPDRLSASIRYQHGLEGGQTYSDQNEPGSPGGKVDQSQSNFIMIDFRLVWF